MMKKSLSSVSRSTLSSLGIILNLIVSPTQAMDNPFPDDIFVPTCRHLSIQELRRCAQVCSRWNRILSDDYVWEETARLYEESGGKFSLQFKPSFFSSPSWKEILNVSYPEWEEQKIKRELANKQENTQLTSIIHLKVYSFFIRPTFEDIKKAKIEQAARSHLHLKLLKLESLKLYIEPFNCESLQLNKLNREPLNLESLQLNKLNREPLNLESLKLNLEPLTS